MISLQHLDFLLSLSILKDISPKLQYDSHFLRKNSDLNKLRTGVAKNGILESRKNLERGMK